MGILVLGEAWKIEVQVGQASRETGAVLEENGVQKCVYQMTVF